MYRLKMTPNTANGLLITFCGLDGCGKTTTIRHLQKVLEKEHSVFLTKQPTDAVRTSPIFRAYMDTPDHSAYDYRCLSLLAAGDRLQHVNSIIRPALESGKVVLSDRYFYSCLANLHARGFVRDKWIHEIVHPILRPDLAFFFDLPVETAIARVRSRPAERDRYIDIPLQYRLREEYRKICRANGGILIPSDTPPEETFAIVEKAVKEKTEKKYNRRKEIKNEA